MKSTKLIQFRPSQERHQTGAVLVELSLIIPMLTFLILAVTDFGMFLQSYFQICHIAREGLRTAVSIPDLSGASENIGKYVVTTDTASVISYTPATPSVEHQFIHDRLLMLLKADNGSSASHALQLANNEVEIKTRCFPGAPGNDRVEVELTTEYKPITPFNSLLGVLGFTPLTFNFTTKSQGAYLFTNCAP